MKPKLQTIMTQDEFQKIADKPLPTAVELFTSLNQFHSMLYDAFGYSLVRVREALKKTHCKNSIKWFRPQAIRFYVHDFMNQKGIKAQLVDEKDDVEENELIFEPRVSANNGIAGNINNYDYRILKIFNGGLPPPVSKKRKEYYSQPHLKEYKLMLPGLSGNTKNKIILKPNLIYLWDIVKNHINLYLAIPKHHLLYATTEITLIPNPISTMKQIEVEVEEETEVEEQPITEVENTYDIRRTSQTGT